MQSSNGNENNGVTEINVTPDYDRLFASMLREARDQGEAASLFRDLRPKATQIEALRAVQRFLAPLAIAAAAMHTVAMVEQFRDVLCAINTGIDAQANELEAETTWRRQ